jgi:hypothetical protein
MGFLSEGVQAAAAVSGLKPSKLSNTSMKPGTVASLPSREARG